MKISASRLIVWSLAFFAPLDAIPVAERNSGIASSNIKRQFISPDQFVDQIIAAQQSAASVSNAKGSTPTTTTTTTKQTTASAKIDPIDPQVVAMKCANVDSLPKAVSTLLDIAPVQVGVFKDFCSFDLTPAKIRRLKNLGYETVWEDGVAHIVKIKQIGDITVTPETSGQQSSVPGSLLFGQVTLVPGDVLILSNDTAQLVYGSKLLSSVSIAAADLIQGIQNMDERWLPFLLQVSPRALPVFINSTQMAYLNKLGWQLNLTPERKFTLTNPNLGNYNMSNPIVPYPYPYSNTTTANTGFLLQHQVLLARLPAPQPLIMDYLMEQLGYFNSAIDTGTYINGNMMVLAAEQVRALLEGKYSWQKASSEVPGGYYLGVSSKGSGALKAPFDPFFAGLYSGNSESGNSTLASAWQLMLPYGHLSKLVNNVATSTSGLTNTSVVITNSSDPNGSILQKIMQITGSPIVTLTNAPTPFDQSNLLEEAKETDFATDPQDDWTLGKHRTVKRAIDNSKLNIQDLFNSDTDFKLIDRAAFWTISISSIEGNEKRYIDQSLPKDALDRISSRINPHQTVLSPSRSISPKELSSSYQRCKTPMVLSLARGFDNALTSLLSMRHSLSASFKIVRKGVNEALGYDTYDDNEDDDDRIYS